jgi:hypothetical protein
MPIKDIVAVHPEKQELLIVKESVTFNYHWALNG